MEAIASDAAGTVYVAGHGADRAFLPRVLKLAVLLLVVALVARRVLPRRRLPWAVPLALVAGLLVVRGIGWASGD